MEVGGADDTGILLLHCAGMAMEVQHRRVQALDLETRRDLEEDVLLADVRSPAVPQGDLRVALAGGHPVAERLAVAVIEAHIPARLHGHNTPGV